MRSDNPFMQPSFSIHIAKNSFIKCHLHKRLELAYVAQGEMEHVINGKTQHLRAGNYFIVDYGVPHSYQRISEEKLVVRNYLFNPQFLDRSLTGSCRFQDMMRAYLLRFCYQVLTFDPTGIPFEDTDGKVRSLLDAIEEEYYAERYGYLEFIRCELGKVLILTARKIGRQPTQIAPSKAVQKTKQYADLHYLEPVKLNDAADDLGYSPTYLSQKFSKEMGLSFTDYLHQLRLQHGCALLENTDLTVAQVAEAVGYEGAKYFTQLFKKHLGTTPAKFRKQL